MYYIHFVYCTSDRLMIQLYTHFFELVRNEWNEQITKIKSRQQREAASCIACVCRSGKLCHYTCFSKRLYGAFRHLSSEAHVASHTWFRWCFFFASHTWIRRMFMCCNRLPAGKNVIFFQTHTKLANKFNYLESIVRFFCQLSRNIRNAPCDYDGIWSGGHGKTKHRCR